MRIMLPTKNVLQRVFRIAHENKEGTCFTIDVEGRQYLITAKHLVQSIQKPYVVDLYHDGEWKFLQVDLVGHGAKCVDLTVLAAEQQISPTHPLEPTTEGLLLGQEVLFLGFPYGITSDSGNINNRFPFPLVKKGIVSALFPDNANDLFLDGHNNPGFSGGPVVYEVVKETLNVAGVVSGYLSKSEPVYDEHGATALQHDYNTGIVRVTSIHHAVDLIRANPVGFKLALQGG